MRIETINKKIYNLVDVLANEDLKAKVLEKHRDINVDDNDWWGCVYNDMYTKLRSLGFMDCKIWFNGFHSQGDGACFDCSDFDVDLLANAVDLPDKHKKILHKIKEYLNISIYKNNCATHYYHEKTRCLGIDIVDRPRVDKIISEFETQLEQLRLNLACEIYNNLEKEYNTLQTDDEVIETLKANEYEFDEEGNIY